MSSFPDSSQGLCEIPADHRRYKFSGRRKVRQVWSRNCDFDRGGASIPAGGAADTDGTDIVSEERGGRDDGGDGQTAEPRPKKTDKK